MAYVVTQPVLETNENHAVLYLASAVKSSNPARVIAAGNRINGVHWAADGLSLAYLLETKTSSNIWRARSDGSQPEQLTDVKGHIAQDWASLHGETAEPYAMSPDGTRFVYATYDTAAADREEAAAQQGGVVYSGEFLKPLSDLEYRRVPLNLWVYEATSRRTTKIWSADTLTHQGQSMGLPNYRWAPNGKTLALLYQAADSGTYSLSLLDTNLGVAKTVLTKLGFSRHLAWSEDGHSLLLESVGVVKSGQPAHPSVTYEFKIDNGSFHQVDEQEAAGSQKTSFTSADAEVRLSARVKDLIGAILSSCSFNSTNTLAACIQQSPITPPEVVIVDCRNSVSVGNIHVLTHLNPPFDSIELGSISDLTWPNKQGKGSAGVIFPTGFQPGKRYPLLVMLYNLYNGREFIADAGGFTSYPAQAFAGHGYVVLLMNVPPYSGYPPGNFEAAKEIQIDRVVADIKTAVDLLDGRKIIDTVNMGIMGWSGGCFWSSYIATHFPNWFQTAAAGECAVHYPGQYWLGDDKWRNAERKFFGGGPYGKYYSRWKEVSPVLNVDRLTVPLLLEYGPTYTAGLEMLTAIQEAGRQAELVIYPDDAHIFLRPLNRYNSMMRHYDWFNFWLMGEEDSDPKKHDQYARWNLMRQKPTDP